MDAKTMVDKLRFKGMFPEEKIDVIRYLRKEGLSAYQIALKLQMTPQAIYYWMKKAGIG
jgi:transposase-like protein